MNDKQTKHFRIAGVVLHTLSLMTQRSRVFAARLMLAFPRTFYRPPRSIDVEHTIQMCSTSSYVRIFLMCIFSIRNDFAYGLLLVICRCIRPHWFSICPTSGIPSGFL